MIKIGAKKNFVKNCSQFSVLWEHRPQDPDALGLIHKPTGSRALLVNVSESSSQKIFKCHPNFFTLIFSETSKEIIEIGRYNKSNSYSGNLFLFILNIFRKKENSKNVFTFARRGSCISLTRAEAILFLPKNPFNYQLHRKKLWGHFRT